MRTVSVIVALCASLLSQSATRWTAVAPGVWRIRFGTPETFDLRGVVGREPRKDALAGLPKAALPAASDAITGRVVGGKTHLRFPFDPEHDVYGLGLDFTRVRRNGQIFTLHVDHWGGRSGRTHAPIPFWVTSQGYGVFINSARYLRCWVGTSLRGDAPNPPPIKDRNRDADWKAHPRSDAIDVLVPAPGAEVFVFAGPTPLLAVQRFVLFQGGGALPPRWGLGFTHRTPTRYSDRQLLAEVREFEEHGFPLDFIGIEPGWHSSAYPCTFEWDRERFPKPKELIETLRRQGVRVNLWMNPYVRPGSKLHGRLAPFAASHQVWCGIVPDYEIPAARRVFAKHLDEVTVGIGVSGFKVDEVDGFDRWLWPDVATFPSGLEAEQIRQTYGMRIQRIIDDLYRARDLRTWGLVRATNAGAASLPFVVYNDHYSHQDFITALCSSSFQGVLWTPEVRSSKTAEEWLRRMQTVCFSPMAMLNAWASGTKPWSFPEVRDAVREVALLRMRLQPYLYSAFADYHHLGIPPVRAMPLVPGFADVADARTRRRRLRDQFMVGPSLLVAPLFAGEKSREIVLPPGRWYDFHTGTLFGTGGVHRVTPEDGKIPVLVRDGALIPLGPAVLHTPPPKARSPLEVRHYGQKPGTYRLYDDDGTTRAHERGDRVWISLAVSRTDDGWQGRIQGPRDRFATYGDVQWRFMTKDR